MATYITGTIQTAQGNAASYTHVLFTPLPQSFPTESGIFVTMATPIGITTQEAGSFNLPLVIGYYQVDVLLDPVNSFVILVPDSGDTVNIGDIIVNAPVSNPPAPPSSQGSPEGVYTANPGTYYWDSLNLVQYVKNSGTGTTGWIPLTQQIPQ